MEHEHEIEQRTGPHPRILEIAHGGALDAAHYVEELVASVRDERLDVEGEAGLEDPEALQAEGAGEGGIRDEQAGVEGESEGKGSGGGGDEGGDGVALGLEVGGLEGGDGGGDEGADEEGDGEEGERQVVGKGEERGGVVDEEGEGEEEEEEERGEGLEGGQAVDGGASLDEGVGCGGEECLVDDGGEERKDNEVERQVFEARRRRRR